MSAAIYRVQDAEGRGPWRPGFSLLWVRERPDHDNLKPWPVEFRHGLRVSGCAPGCCEDLGRERNSARLPTGAGAPAVAPTARKDHGET